MVSQKISFLTDCRPIYVEESIKDAGYQVRHKERMKLFGLPLEIVIAEK